MQPEYRPSKPIKSRYSVKREPMVCDYCEQKFTTLENFEIHIRRVHGEQFSRSFFSCQICTQHFLSSEALYEHIACAHQLTEDDEEKGDQLCAYCAELLLSWQDLADHLIAVHNVYMCKTCHVLCETEETLESHITTTHLTGIRPELMDAIPEPPKPIGRPPNTTPKLYMPVQAFGTPTSPRKRGRPRKVPLTEDETRGIICKICKIKFPTEESLKKHIVYRHEPAPKELLCKKCNLKFRRRSALENHMRIVHNKSEISDTDDEMVLGPASIPMASTSTADSLSPSTKEAGRTGNLRTGGRIYCDVCGEMCAKPEEQEIHKDHHATRRMDRFLCLYCTGKFLLEL